MRKQIAVFSILIFVSSVSGIQITHLETFKLKENIRDYKTSSKPNFSVLVSSNHRAVLFQNNDSKTILKRNSPGNVAPSIDKIQVGNKTNWLLGTQYIRPKWIIFGPEGTAKSSSKERLAHDRGAFISENKVFTSGGQNSEIDSRNGELIKNLNLADGWMIPEIVADLDDDRERELLLRRASGKFYSFLDNGKEKWTISNNVPEETKKLSEDYFVARNKTHISLSSWKDGSQIWSVPIETASLPLEIQNKLYAFSSGNLHVLNKSNGESIEKRSTNIKPDEVKLVSKKGEISAISRNRLLLYNKTKYEVERFNSDLRDLRTIEIQNQTFISFIEGQNLHLYRIKSGSETSIFKNKLQAIAQNESVKLNSGELEDKSSKKNYFVESKNKQVYVAALAAEDNASITFERSEADRDFSNYSIRELKEEFLERYESNHVVVADLDSKSGLLAGFMAVKQGALPVDFEHERVHGRGSLGYIGAERYNEDNGVIKLREKVRDNFELIGLNSEVVADGRYLSILDGPRKAYEDPVENGLIGDGKDGDYFFSDKAYGDIDGDGELEAAVGRYPDNVTLAAEMFRNSLEKERGGKAVVASEYLYSYGPEVLANFGGGVWHGKNTGNAMDRQNYSVTVLSEHRARPVSLFFKLIGAKDTLDIIFDSFKQTRATVVSYAGESTFKIVKKALFIIKKLEDAKDVFQVYLEHDWRNWKPLDDVDLPTEASRDEVGDLVVSLLPERYDELNSSALNKELKNSSAVYYAGIGDSEKWVMPGEPDITGRYNDKNNFTADRIPRLDNAIVWDSSDLAAKKDGKMMKGFAEKGATNFVGASSASYSSYSAVAANEFFRHGKKVGRSYKDVVNELSDRFVMPSTKSAYRTGVQEKIADSLSLYGNPETPKDPVEENALTPDTSCSEEKCKLKLEIVPERENISTSEGYKFLFDANEHLYQPSLPITPLYKMEHELPEADVLGTKVDLDFSYVENVSPTIIQPVTGSGKVYNSSIDYSKFPERSYRLESVGGELEYVQPAAIYFGNGSAKILEKAEVEVSYKPEVVIEVYADNSSIKASLNGEADKLYYSIGDNYSVLDEPGNEVTLGEVAPGRHNVEVYAARNRKKVGYTREEVTISEPPEITLFAPDIHGNSVREIRAIVKNPNNFSISKELVVETGRGIQLAFLETARRGVDVESNSQEQLSWSFTGIKEGNSRIELEGTSVNITVKPEVDSEKLLSAESLKQTFSSPDQKVTFSRSSDSSKIKLETAKGFIEKTKTPDNTTYELRTGEFRFKKFESSEKEYLKLLNGKGSYIETTKTTLSKGVDKKAFEDRKKVFLRESSKLDNIAEELKP